MIIITTGDLVKTDAEALVNTVNCVGVMGKGIALQFKQAFPANYEAYRRACETYQVRPGSMFVFATNSLVNPKYIINFPTKRHWKGKARLEDIRIGLEALAKEIERLDIQSVAVPPLGCGHGGLEWVKVRPMIENALSELEGVEVTLFAPSGAPAPDTIQVRTKAPGMTRGRALLLRLLGLYGMQDYRHSMLEVQKLAYFLQEAGEPLKLKFVKHSYGPYAETLHHVLQRMDGHFIRGYGDRSRRSQIFVLPGVEQAAEKYLATDTAANQRLERVRNLIDGYETPYGLELLATLHWVAREDALAASDSDEAIKVVHAWNARKRRIFPAEHIRIAWRHLNNQGWLHSH